MKKQSRTVIAVIKNKKGKLIMAGDRQASLDWGMGVTMPRPKINKRNKILLGATGSGGLCTLFVDVMEIPDIETDLDTYMFYVFRKSMMKALKSQGYVDKDGSLRLPVDTYCELVIGMQGKCYSVIVSNGDLAEDHYGSQIMIDENPVPYATGCGGLPALGVLKGKLLEEGQNTQEHLELAVKVACDISPGCGLPLDIIKE
jgi:ATP-dependent protease HslVU (ClpYQ) peptidase subunit